VGLENVAERMGIQPEVTDLDDFQQAEQDLRYQAQMWVSPAFFEVWIQNTGLTERQNEHLRELYETELR